MTATMRMLALFAAASLAMLAHSQPILAEDAKPLGSTDAAAPKTALERAKALTEAGKYAEAEAAAREALAEAETRDGAESLAAAEALAALVGPLLYQGRAAEPATRAVAERSLAILEKVLGPDHPDVAASLNNLAYLLQDSGDYAGARPIYERSLAIAEKALGRDHPNVAIALWSLADLLQATGDYAGARQLNERALAINEKALGPDHPDVALSLNNLGNLLHVTGELAGARRLLERALSIREKALGPDHPDVSQSLNNLAATLRAAGDYAGARQHFERALAIYENVLGPDHPDVATGLNNLGTLLQDAGDYAGARPLYERALAIFEKALGANHPNVATSLQNLASLLAAMGDYAAARPLLERALAIDEKALGPDHPDVAVGLNYLADLLEATGDYAGARPLYERALAIAAEALGPDHSDVARYLNNLGYLLWVKGDYAGARPLFERALASCERSLGPDHPRVAMGSNNLARLLQDTGDNTGARPLYERAIAIREKALGPDHPNVAQGLNNLAGLLASLGERTRALELALRAETIGRDHARRTLRVLSERQALALSASRSGGLGVALSVAASSVDGASRARAWDSVIRSRAFVLDETSARHRVTTAGASPAATQAAAAWRSASQRLANLTIRGVGALSPAAYRALLDQSSKDLETAERALAEQSASFREERTRAAVGFDDVAKSLAPGDALVAFSSYASSFVATKPEDVPKPGVAAPKGVPSYTAFVLRAGQKEPQVVALGPAEDLELRVERWRNAVSSSAADAETTRRAGEALRAAAWDPLLAALGDAHRVYIVPDGALHVVSFAALPMGADRYLVESGPTLHYLSAERDLVPSTLTPKQGEGLFAIGGAAYDDTTLFAALTHPAIATKLATVTPTQPTGQQAPLTQAASDAATTLLTKVAGLLFRGETSHCPGFTSMKPFENLPGAAAEAEEVAALWKAQSPHAVPATEVTRLAGAAASEAALKTGAAGRRVLHLATHGFFLGGECESALDAARGIKGLSDSSATPPSLTGENPLLLSGLVLAGANHRSAVGPGEEDGILTAEEIASLDLSGVEWAVLSACGSGLGDIKAGEGVLGLERAFRVAGAQTVIMSLWDVDDAATREWMKSLYEARLVKKLDTADCVREASLAVLKDRRAKGLSAHPFYWGAFVAAGDSR